MYLPSLVKVPKYLHSSGLWMYSEIERSYIDRGGWLQGLI